MAATATRSTRKTPASRNGRPLEMTLETITPEIAEKYLQHNVSNRKIRPTTISRYAHDMAAGRWEVNGVAVVFNKKGELDNGQHRLLACIEAGKPFTTYVLRNATAASKLVHDTGERRTAADVLRWMGYSDAPQLAALSRLAWKHDNGALIERWLTPSMPEQIDYIKKHHEELVYSLYEARRMKNRTSLTITATGLAHLLTARVDRVDADAFVQQAIDGTGLPVGSPVLALLTWAHNQVVSKQNKPDSVMQAAITLKAMNFWRQGETVRALVWRRGGPQPETFPTAWIQP